MTAPEVRTPPPATACTGVLASASHQRRSNLHHNICIILRSAGRDWFRFCVSFLLLKVRIYPFLPIVLPLFVTNWHAAIKVKRIFILLAETPLRLSTLNSYLHVVDSTEYRVLGWCGVTRLFGNCITIVSLSALT